MTQKEFVLLMSYLMNNEDRLKGELDQLQGNIRYRHITDVDCMELLVSSVRYETFKEVSKNIRLLLNIDERQYRAFLRSLYEKELGE